MSEENENSRNSLSDKMVPALRNDLKFSITRTFININSKKCPGTSIHVIEI